MTALISTPPAHLHPGYESAPRTMRVSEVAELTPEIKHFRFESIDDTPLRPFQPGSHVIVAAGEHRNAYSLVDDGMCPTSYGISVLRRGEGGGSDWLHANLKVGDEIEIEGPRTMFAPVIGQRRVLLVAGGIGITPILSHARAAVRENLDAEVIYSHRPGHAAHLADLAALPGITVREVTGVEETVSAIRAAFARQPLGTHAYACGPIALLDTYLEVAADSGWPKARVHLERFTAPEQDAGEPFTVRMSGTGVDIDVPSGVSLLQRLLDNGIAVSNMCRQGVCGECRITVNAGHIEHRDSVLTDEEKAAGDTMLCCVSRGHDLEVQL